MNTRKTPENENLHRTPGFISSSSPGPIPGLMPGFIRGLSCGPIPGPSPGRISRLITGLVLILLLAGMAVPVSAAGITASRDIPDGPVYAGGTFTVRVNVQAGEYLEAPALDENLPAGWSVSPVENDGAVFKRSTLEWVWTESLSAGSEKNIAYRVIIPSSPEPRTYTISGTVSAYSISPVTVGGDSDVTVTYPPPEADFSANPLSGTAPLTVAFTDLSTGNPDSWEWDFDGDGNFDSNETNPTYTYETPGSYNVTLRAASSSYGSDTETKTGYITVTKKTASSGGGGGGGGAGSAEPNSNIELKEISNEQVFKGSHARYTFKGETNEIVSVEFDPKKSFGKTTAIIEMLKNTSTLAEEPAPGTVYRNMNIWVGNSGFSSPENLENAKISFRVNIAWISEQIIKKSTITLYRYSEGTWAPLPTTLIGEDKTYLYFTAETPGFSPFAISGTSENNGKIEILPSETGEYRDSLGLLSEEEISGEEKQGTPAQDSEAEEEEQKEGEKENKAPGPGTVFAAAGVLASYVALKRKNKE